MKVCSSVHYNGSASSLKEKSNLEFDVQGTFNKHGKLHTHVSVGT